MDCSKAWNLMMKHFDDDISPEQDHQLMIHLEHCTPCKNEFDALSSAFADMEELKVVAPPDLEQQIMKKIKKMEKERQLSLSIIIAPMLVLIALMALGILMIIQIGPLAILAQFAHFITWIYRTINGAITFSVHILNPFYIRSAVIILLIIGVICAGLYMVRNCRKAKRSINGG